MPSDTSPQSSPQQPKPAGQNAKLYRQPIERERESNNSNRKPRNTAAKNQATQQVYTCSSAISNQKHVSKLPQLQTEAGKGSENQNPASRTKAITNKKQAGKTAAHPAAWLSNKKP
jgi:hypothetical protein